MIQSLGLEEIQEIKIHNIIKAIKQLENNRAFGNDWAIPELIKLGVDEFLKKAKILYCNKKTGTKPLVPHVWKIYNNNNKQTD